MTMRPRPSGFVFAAFVLLTLAASVLAQSPVTATDVLQLETSADDASKQIATLRKTDATLATELDKKLADLREEVTYLKVKLRRDGGVTRAEYLDVRDRLDKLRVRAQGEKVTGQPVLPDGASSKRPAHQVPVGTKFDLRLQTLLDSTLAKFGDRFVGVTLMDFKMGDEIVIPAGSPVRGFVASVRASGATDHRATLTLAFEEITVGGVSFRLRASVEQALDGKALDGRAVDDMTRLDLGASAGAIIGVKATLAGVFVDSAGTITSTEGRNVDLPEGTILRIRLDQPVDIR
jgi:hypothetical protein